MWAVNAMGVLRVTEEGETFGLDLHEHGISAYPEYMITSAGMPSGMGSGGKESAKLTPQPAPRAIAETSH
jgi:Amt family ammonium transporter